MTPPRYVLIANPGTKRCETYLRELRTFWVNRGATPEVEVVPWADVVARDGCLDELPTFDRAAVVRLESPGKDDHVLRLMLQTGARGNPAEPRRDWQSVELPMGLLLKPGLWYRGFRHVLYGLKRSFKERRHLRPAACPLAIAEMFDKTRTSEKLDAAGVPTPKWLADPHRVVQGIHKPWRRIYLKLNTGSSASGIIAMQEEESLLIGTTTLVEIDGRFFNTRRLRRLAGEPLRRAADFLFEEGAFAQQGIPLAQIDGQNFDVRVVCIHGKPAAVIFRLSAGPMTNLHLGGRRGDYARCRSAIPTREWLDALDHCADAAGCFDAAMVGVDLVFERGFRRHYVLEVNAFGDFFPGWVDERGRSVHALEIAEMSCNTI
jgi:glutathione synthase/RimK-type ligase-like ATP-grasp enzyme